MVNRKRYPYTKRLKLVKEGASAENIDDDKVRDGRALVLTSISVEDKTSDLTKVRIGKVTGGYFLPWEEALTPAVGELSFSSEEHWLRQGEHFRAVLTGGNAKDVCFVYLDGYWKKCQDGDP